MAGKVHEAGEIAWEKTTDSDARASIVGVGGADSFRYERASARSVSMTIRMTFGRLVVSPRTRSALAMGKFSPKECCETNQAPATN
jgi:hypothetical protein